MYFWNLNALTATKSKLHILSIMVTVRVTRSLTLVYGQGHKVIDLGVIWKGYISWVCMSNKRYGQGWSQFPQTHKQTDRTKTRWPEFQSMKEQQDKTKSFGKIILLRFINFGEKEWNSRSRISVLYLGEISSKKDSQKACTSWACEFGLFIYSRLVHCSYYKYRRLLYTCRSSKISTTKPLGWVSVLIADKSRSETQCELHDLYAINLIRKQYCCSWV